MSGLTVSPITSEDRASADRGLWTRAQTAVVATLAGLAWSIAGGLACALWAGLTALYLVGGI